MFKQKNTLLLLFFGIILFCLIRIVLSFDGLYGQDAYEYFRFSKSLHNYFTSEKLPGDYFWGVYYPLLGSFLTFIVGNSALALQLISFISLLVSSIYLNKIIELIYKEKTNSLIIFVFFTLSPIILIHSLLVMSDMLTCAFLLISIYHLLNYLENFKKSSFLIGITFCLIAVLTRYAAIVILLPIGLAVAIKLIKNKHFSLLLFTLPIIAAISLPHVAIKLQNSIQFLSHSWLQNWNILNLFKSDFITQEGPRNNHFINLIYICFTFLHPIFMFFGIGIIGYSIKNRITKWNNYQFLLVVSNLVYLLFIGGIPYQNKRYLIPAFALIVILIYPQLRNITLNIKHKKAMYLVMFLIQISLAIYFGKQFYDRNILEKNIVKVMKPYQGNTLYIFDIDVAMQGRGLKFYYKNLFLEKYNVYERNALILINEKQITQQWKDKNPLINWENIQKKCLLIKLKTSDKNWSLYKISDLK